MTRSHSTLTPRSKSRLTPGSLAPATSAPVIGPVPGQERIGAIDILRGVAILGILIVNMGLFSSGDDVLAREIWPNAVDGTVERLILFFAQEKFKALFSFLFGLGLAVQMMHADARGARFLPVFLRRLFFLLAIGIAHFLLLWDGDILHDYALLGFALILFRRCSPRTLLAWASAFLSVAMLFSGITTYYSVKREAPPPLKSWISYETGHETGAEEESTGEDDGHIYSSGTYAEMIAFRARELPRDVSPDTDDAYMMTFLLLGLYAGRRRLAHDVAAHRALIRRVQRWGVVIGLAGNAAFAVWGASDPSLDSVSENLGRVCLLFGAPAMTLFYASTIALLTQDETWRRRLAPLAAVGRMALSNYLLQSIICTLIFYSYGLALFGKVRPSLGLLLTVAIFLIQVPLSVWWLQRFRFGPVEWLWRSLTYWRRQPMRDSWAGLVAAE